jgi:hypothetical protein
MIFFSHINEEVRDGKGSEKQQQQRNIIKKKTSSLASVYK